jgi:hypothetical protein
MALWTIEKSILQGVYRPIAEFYHTYDRRRDVPVSGGSAETAESAEAESPTMWLRFGFSGNSQTFKWPCICGDDFVHV